MQHYRIFVRRPGGAFRYFGVSFFDSDSQAHDFAAQILPHCGGVDVWCGDRRVVLLYMQ